MAHNSVIATLVILTAILQSHSAPRRPTLGRFKLRSTNSSTTVVKSTGRFTSIGKLNTKLKQKKVEYQSCNKTAVKPPSYVVEKKLYSERRYLIQMKQDGRVGGTAVIPTNNPWVKFLVESVGDEGLFRAKGKKSSLYLSMDKRGKFYGRRRPNTESVFKKISTNHGFMAFQSYKYCSQYIAMKRNGHLKSTDKTNHSTHFLLIP